MHFGLFNLMTQRDPAKAPQAIYREMVEQVKLADELDYEVAWFAAAARALAAWTTSSSSTIV